MVQQGLNVCQGLGVVGLGWPFGEAVLVQVVLDWESGGGVCA
jgi:hypothetical protein